MAIGTWADVAIDCADPEELATFYAGLSGKELHDWGGGMYSVGGQSSIQLIFQKVEGYKAPTWPSQTRGQQMHLDFRVADLEKAVAAAIELGAKEAPEQYGDTWRIMLDPAGHPFCLAASGE